MSLNPEALSLFSDAYRAGLARAVEAEPDEYAYLPSEAPRVVAIMMGHIARNPHGVNYNGGGFRRACRTLGIKHTRKAILAFLGVSS